MNNKQLIRCENVVFLPMRYERTICREPTPTHAANEERRFDITIFGNKFASTKHQGSSSISELIDLIEKTSAMGKDNLPLLKLALFGNKKTEDGALRSDANVLSITGVEIDYDGSKVPVGSRVTFEQACTRITKAGIETLLYTTPSCTPDEPVHWRVLAPFAEHITGTEEEMRTQRAALVRRLDKALGGIAFPESFILSLSYYFGRIKHKIEMLRTDGQRIDEMPELDDLKVDPPPLPPKDGKPDGKTTEDDGELIRRISKGDGRHNSLLTLTARYIARGYDPQGIINSLCGILDGSDLPRDAKFKKRYAEIPKLVQSAVGKGFAPPKKTIERPDISVYVGRITEAQDAVAAALVKLAPELGLYVNGSRLVKPSIVPREGFADVNGVREQTESLELIPRTLATFQSAINRGVAFKQWKQDKGKQAYSVKADCPDKVARALYEDPDQWRNWPRIERVAEVPIFDGKQLHGGPGLVGATWINAPVGVKLAKLNRATAIRALERIAGYLQEFPFTTVSDGTTAVALLLTAALRPSMGAAPGFLIDKHDYGSGATTLGRIAGIIATGRAPPVLNVARKEEEFEKMLAAALMQGRHVIAFDNVPEGLALGGSLLAQLMTEPQCEPRVLGESRNVTCDTVRLVLATGVNITVIDDQVRRFLKTQIDPKMEDPSSRKFKRPTLVDDMRRERVAILSDLFTITASYLRSGEHAKTAAFVGFEQWTHWVAEPLAWLGLPDIISTSRTKKVASPEDMLLRRILSVWADMQDKAGMTVHELMRDGSGDGGTRAQQRKELKSLFGEVTNAREENGVPQLSSRSVGKWIARMEGRIRGKARFERGAQVEEGYLWKAAHIDADNEDSGG
jgi:hypothetical protein